MSKSKRAKEAKKATSEAGKIEATGMVEVKMLSNYRDIAKTGDIVEFDKEKAEELVRLKRAEYLN